MMKIGLVCDSPTDLSEELVNRYRIQVVPAILVLDDHAYQDGIEITRSEFYERLPLLRRSPSTAAPSGESMAARYQALLNAGCDHVIGIFTAEKLTAIADIARKTAEEFAGKISVIESGSLSMGTGYQVLAAAEGIEQGQPLTEILQAIQSVRERTRTYAALDTVEYLRRSGRVPQAAATLGSLLSIKPIVELREGVVKPVDAPRTTSKATGKLFNILDELGPLERLSILHTNAEQRAREFLDRLANIRQNLPVDIHIVNVTTVIGTHVGPHGLGFAAVRRKN